MSQSLYSTHLAAEVRRFFGLSQAELGRYLGVSAIQVGHVEAGRRGFTARAESRLLTLAQLLPLPYGAGAPLEMSAEAEPALGPGGAPAAGPLEARLRRCEYLAERTRFEQQEQRQRVAATARRRAALVRLRAALLPPGPPDPARPADPAFDPAHAARWLARLTADTAAAPAPPTPAEQTLLAVRLATLEFEAAQLRQALDG